MISTLCDSGVRPPQSLFDSASSLSRDLEDARQSSSRPGVPSSAKPSSAQAGPSRPEFDPAVPGPSRRRSFDSPQRSSGHSSRQGSDTPPRKRRRLSDESSDDEDSSSQARRQRDDQQDEEDNFRPSSLDLLLKYITKKFPAASKPLVQPSSKQFHVMETAGLVDESSQQSSNLAWFGHFRSACESAQRKFEAKVSEGKSLSSLLTSVSRTERVSDLPCQGRAVKVNSQVFDLMGSKPSESRSIPLSVREAASLETALRGVMESYNFQLWTVTALFCFLGDSGCCPMDDPLLDQFQRSFSKGAENVAVALASTTAFVTAKRRESFLTHMVPSVTDAQKRKLLSDPFRRIFLCLPRLRLPAKRQGTSPCIEELSLALPCRLARIRDDNFLRHHPGVVLSRLLGQRRSVLQHHLLRGASSRRRSRPIPLRNVGVFGGRSLSPRPA